MIQMFKIVKVNIWKEPFSNAWQIPKMFKVLSQFWNKVLYLFLCVFNVKVLQLLRFVVSMSEDNEDGLDGFGLDRPYTCAIQYSSNLQHTFRFWRLFSNLQTLSRESKKAQRGMWLWVEMGLLRVDAVRTSCVEKRWHVNNRLARSMKS